MSVRTRPFERFSLPLGTQSQRDILQARRLVHLGIEAYFQAKLAESLRFYDLADAAVEGTGSVFDELWIKLNRADSRLSQREVMLLAGNLTSRPLRTS